MFGMMRYRNMCENNPNPRPAIINHRMKNMLISTKAAGMAAIAHLIMKTTMLQNGI